MTPKKPAHVDPTVGLPPLPLKPAEWRKVMESLGLCPRHGRIVELVLRDASDAQIAAALGVAPSTLKTYLRRIRDRTHTQSRMQLAMRVLAVALEILTDEQRPPTG